MRFCPGRNRPFLTMCLRPEVFAPPHRLQCGRSGRLLGWSHKFRTAQASLGVKLSIPYCHSMRFAVHNDERVEATPGAVGFALGVVLS